MDCFQMRKIATSVINFLGTGILLFNVSCNQEHAFDCAKSTGEILQVEKVVTPFHYVILEDNIDLVVKNGTDNVATVEAGKNLMPKIALQSQGDTLIISNRNTCNWLRNFKHRITVSLTLPEDAVSLIHRGYGTINSSDVLQVDNLTIYSLDAGGNIDLQLNAGIVIAYSNSHSFIQLNGRADNLDIWMHKGIGRVFAEKLKAINCHVKHEGSNEIRIFPVQEGNVEIFASGNVVYYSEPLTMSSNIKGTGKLIKK
ncbi:DUF2807 domain-containing protein [Rhodocytophaga rosea]|uniref:DUF2807 domain-containing protein n=1 Tax=Rhodocytophaga rosea TaxID=2704465 RepID=A0A6C0GPD1_9BACT|nr:DUF2807 domain-containing protein [Rhodocytophaga rosea]QHT69899.1 DUF2807 domain-containing protein [Rhodocytophaga rosea]